MIVTLIFHNYASVRNVSKGSNEGDVDNNCSEDSLSGGSNEFKEDASNHCNGDERCEQLSREWFGELQCEHIRAPHMCVSCLHAAVVWPFRPHRIHVRMLIPRQPADVWSAIPHRTHTIFDDRISDDDGASR
jgi:hypothetical protein